MAADQLLSFLRVFFRNPARTGAVAPSTSYLARAMASGLSVSSGEMVVEFGPGTGALTASIRPLLPSPDCYAGFEVAPDFVRQLRRRFPELRFIEESAERAPERLAEIGCARVRAVICGLPFSTLPPSVQDGVIGALDRMLGPGSEFRTFQYVHAFGMPHAVRFRHRMAELFGPHVRIATVWPNLPPAKVLRWSRPA